MDTDDLPAGQDALQQKLHQVQEELSRSVCYAVPCLLKLWPHSCIKYRKNSASLSVALCRCCKNCGHTIDCNRMLCFFCFTR